MSEFPALEGGGGMSLQAPDSLLTISGSGGVVPQLPVHSLDVAMAAQNFRQLQLSSSSANPLPMMVANGSCDLLVQTIGVSSHAEGNTSLSRRSSTMPSNNCGAGAKESPASSLGVGISSVLKTLTVSPEQPPLEALVMSAAASKHLISPTISQSTI